MTTRESLEWDAREEREYEYAREQFQLAADRAATHVHAKRCDDRPAHECCSLYVDICEALSGAMDRADISRDHTWRFIARWGT